MWYAADNSERLLAAPSFGHDLSAIPHPKFNWSKYKEQRDGYVKMLNGAYERNWAKDGVEYHDGWARLKDKHTVEVTRHDGSKYELVGDNIFIAVGGRPIIPFDNDIPGASLGINSDGFFDIEEQPKSVAVIGSGYIAVEFTGIFNTLGSEAHIFVRGDKVLRKFDQDIQTGLTDWMEHTGVKIHKNSNVVKVEEEANGQKTLYTKEGEKVTVDVVVWAVGRKANTDDLGAEKAGVKLQENGDINVDKYQKTNVDNIFALGDVTGQMLLTPVAIAAGRRLANRLYGPAKYKNQTLEYTNIPTVVFS